MCGIVGTTNTFNFNKVKKCADQISHRGPDYTGLYTDKHISLAHLLLAIRGTTEQSRQPVSKSSSPWVLTFNGQLYNTKQIRSVLGTHAPDSDVDTALLFELINKYSWNFWKHVQGMYAIALYNRKERELRIYRDSSGQKVLYYHISSKGISFSSELKGLLAFSDVPRNINDESFSVAQVIGYIPGSSTLIKNVYKLKPAECLRFSIDKGAHSCELLDYSEPSYFKALDSKSVLKNTVSEHLQSKRELSINLSGGLDSALIFHEAVTQGRKVHAFSTVFDVDGAHFNKDAMLAKRLAHDYGQPHTEIRVSSDSYLENFLDAYKTIEEPNYNISVPIYYQTARAEGSNGMGLRVVLSGDGGDEVFGGYPHYATAARFANLKRKLSPLIVNLYKWFRDGHYANYDNPLEAFLKYRALKTQWSQKTKLFQGAAKYCEKESEQLIREYRRKDDDVYISMLIDRFIWLASENFIRSDKLFMSQSMEMRCPLAYQPLRDYFDSQIKSEEYISRNQNKIFIRRLYENVLPEYIVKRKDKSGWRAPVQIWYDSKYKEFFLDILNEAANRDKFHDWQSAISYVRDKDGWPGKSVHLYLSLAILIHELDLH